MAGFKGYYISVAEGLTDQKHLDKMGKSVFMFIWLLNKMTTQDGKVLGGKPIKLEEFPYPRRTTQRYLAILRHHNYIETIRAPYGIIIKVMKPKKIYQKRYDKSGAPGTTKVAHLSKRDVPKVAHLDTKSGASLTKSGASNKIRQLDKTVDKTSESAKIAKAISATPKNLSIQFFQGGEIRQTIKQKLLKNGVPEEILEREFKKFTLYWTEPNHTGKKERWQMQKTFDVKRRLWTWLNRSKDFHSEKRSENKYQVKTII